MPQGLRILVVEDDADTGEAVQRYLEFLGHVVEVAENRTRAIQLADDMCPEVLICDWKLAGNEDGVEIAGRVRSRLDIPVIVVTGHNLPQARQKARESEVDIAAFRRKPVSLPDLAVLIESLRDAVS